MALVAEPSAAPTPAPARRGRVLGPGPRYVLMRVLASIGTFLFVIAFNFFLFRMVPGDPIALYTRGRDVDVAQIRALRTELDQPLLSQFLGYIKNPFAQTLDSVKYGQPPWEVIGPRVWPTLLLVGTATVIATVLGVWLGIRCGLGPRQAVRQDLDQHDAGALLHAGVLVRHDPADRVLGRRVRAAGHLPRRRPVHPRRGHELAGGMARRRVAPRAARHDPRDHLPRRVLARHARLAHRRDGAGLPADRAGQGPADEMVRTPARRAATRCCRPPR